ncbi:dTDP-4-amino-4,6-dideoxy-D-galactose acyltransferase [Candidatus Providencia siddallii]|uniref:dTDP-fucosamine acetyltransferase n=1 Tax=Candidatus Providencia siddallii TaxID=1715285 RepID=A0ABP1CE52_9GAMM
MCIFADIEFLKWESNFFNRLTARLNFNVNSNRILVSNLDKFDIIHAKVLSSEKILIDNLGKIGFFFIEGEINLLLKISFNNSFFKTVLLEQEKVYVAKVCDIDLLAEVASIIFFEKTRFRFPWYNKKKIKEFYSLWIKKSVLGTFDNVCLLIKDKHKTILGFVTLRDVGVDVAQIGLLAKIPKSSGVNIGKKLMLAVFEWCKKNNKKQLKITTQISNNIALNLYLCSGASIVDISYWLYRGNYDSI